MLRPFVLCAFALFSTDVAAQRVTHRGKTALFGTLHAHSELSADVSDAEGFSPEEAYEHALAQGLDFLGISDHHKPPGAPGMAAFHMEDAIYERELLDVANAFTSAHPGEFVAIPGIEWGTVGTGNHINIFGIPALPPDSIEDDEYVELYAWIGQNALFAQFNHPYGWGAKKRSVRRLDVGNYGVALYPSREDFVAAADPAVQLMSVICTVAGGHISGEHADSTQKTHRDVHSKAWKEYLKHLDMGFHLSPAGNQDTHGQNPGSVTATRTGVWADSFDLEGIGDAFRANRVFATEDDELAVALLIEYQGETYWMGETVPLAAAEDDVIVHVFVDQRPGTDSTAEGPYVVTLLSDSDGVGGQKAAEWESRELSGTTLQFPVPVVDGEYVLIQVTEQNGQDNPVGDGEDEENAAGLVGADGLRDDRNDSAWTSPIWFAQGSTARFVWSRNSSVYHDPDCWAVRRIGAANRRTGPAPAGKTKHGCS